MNLLQITESLRDKVKTAAKDIFNIELSNLVSEVPPKTELGDLAFPVAFELAKQIKAQTGEKQNPRNIAEKLKSVLESDENVQKVQVAGAGYLNVFYNRAKFLAEFDVDFAPKTSTAKRMVEHTSVNPNKAAHIGHVRNSVLGDTFARILSANGETVEVQNYIDNTGVQVADVVVGFVHLEKMTLDDIKTLDAQLSERGENFDYYCWDLYSKVGNFYKENPDNLKLRAETLHAIEAGNDELAKLADYVATRNVEQILKTMNRLDIRYDVLPRESEILHLKFWQTAFEQMQKIGVIRLETTGKNANCWVMPFGDSGGTDEHDSDKILVRSNGTVTYTGKDIAYQMWKLGLLGLDFNYKLFHTYDDGKKVFITTAESVENVYSKDVPKFGDGATVYNVIDSRQSYPQEVVKKGVAEIAPNLGESASVHLSYEMVALSPNAAQELGFELSDADKQKSFVEMSGRKGLGVKADDLITRLESNAFIKVEERNPDLSFDEKQITAHKLAVGALRYFLLKFTRTTVIIFDFAEALAQEGETGFFCQYSAVRGNSLLRKFTEQYGAVDDLTILASDVETILNGDDGDEIWSLLTLAARLEETIESAATNTEPAILAKYTFNLAKAFNLFYHRHRIIVEENQAKRNVLIQVAEITRKQLTKSLSILGIEVPNQM